jgi:hypothetical protein
MNTAIRVHDITHLSDLQRKRRILKRFLHLSSAKVSKISSLLSRATIRISSRELRKPLRKKRRIVNDLVELGLVILKYMNGVTFGASDGFLRNKDVER